MKVILASASPRRKELLGNMGVDFEIITSNIEEVRNEKLSLGKQIEDLAFQKANAVFKTTTGDRLVIGSDTIVCLGKKIFGKPKNEAEGREMLSSLSGKSHKVITGLCVLVERNENITEYKVHHTAKIYFRKITAEEIDKYIKTNEYADKAGAYAIQGKSSVFIDKIKGNYFSVVGLPIHLLYDILRKENIL